jgi:hypothetical protein
MEHFLFACRWLVQALKCCQVQKIVAYRGLYISHGAILFVESTWCVMACTCSMEHFVFACKLPQWWLLRRGPPPLGCMLSFVCFPQPPFGFMLAFGTLATVVFCIWGECSLHWPTRIPLPPESRFHSAQLGFVRTKVICR